MALILHIETTTKNCSVALGENGSLLALKELNDGKYSHAEKLHVFMEQCLQERGKSYKDLDAIAVSKGPGSYTGLRIGVSAAKGMCFALDIPLISTDTLQGLAMQVKEQGTIIPLLDARRLEVYSAVFDTNARQLREIRAELIDEHSFASYLNRGKVYFIGDGVPKTEEVVKHDNAFFINNKLPSAQEMIAVAHQKFLQKDLEDVAYFEPYYLKDFLVTPKKK